MAGQDQFELKFRLIDGTDIGPNSYPPVTTVATLKESILAQWPRGKAGGRPVCFTEKFFFLDVRKATEFHCELLTAASIELLAKEFVNVMT
ncbi:hypothetical protein L7F22_057194 [Adiantum nelumboides]|nr:hypothetical protein [Adiantum nelumboides]